MQFWTVVNLGEGRRGIGLRAGYGSTFFCRYADSSGKGLIVLTKKDGELSSIGVANSPV